MRLSEAIRKGSKMVPQIFGSFYAYNEKGHITGACALGAAFLTENPLMHGDGTKHFSEFRAKWPLLNHWIDGECPCCTELMTDVESAILHLNDTHAWSRELVADWLESTFEGVPIELPQGAERIEHEVI